jgi:hypothetical protein
MCGLMDFTIGVAEPGDGTKAAGRARHVHVPVGYSRGTSGTGMDTACAPDIGADGKGDASASLIRRFSTRLS